MKKGQNGKAGRLAVYRTTIKAFGSLSKTARAVGWPVTTVDSWKRNGIPPWRWDALREAARKSGVRLPKNQAAK